MKDFLKSPLNLRTHPVVRNLYLKGDQEKNRGQDRHILGSKTVFCAVRVLALLIVPPSLAPKHGHWTFLPVKQDETFEV